MMLARPKSRIFSLAGGALCAVAVVVALARCADPTSDDARTHATASIARLDRPFVPPGLAATGRWQREDAAAYGRLHTEAMEFARAETRKLGRGLPRTTREICDLAARVTRDFLLQSRLAGDRGAWTGMRAWLDAPGGRCAGQYDHTLLGPLANRDAPVMSASAVLQDAGFSTTAISLTERIAAGGAAYLDQPDFNALARATTAQAASLSEPDRVLVDVSAAIGIDSYTYWRDNMDAWGAPPSPDMSAFMALQHDELPPSGGSDGSEVPPEPDRRARAGALVNQDVDGGVRAAGLAAFALGPAIFTPTGLGAIGTAAAGGAITSSFFEMVSQLIGTSRPRRPSGGYGCRDGGKEGWGGWCTYGSGAQQDS